MLRRSATPFSIVKNALKENKESDNKGRKNKSCFKTRKPWNKKLLEKNSKKSNLSNEKLKDKQERSKKMR